MRKLLVLTGAALLSGLLVATAMAQDAATPGAQPQGQEPGAVPVEAAPAEVVPGEVPQAQIDIVNKREEAKQRRDELLKMRAQAVQAGD